MFQFDSFQDFLTMAGHGPYVWWSYGISLLVMAYLVASPLLRSRRQLDAIRRQQSVRQRRSPGARRETDRQAAEN